MVGNRHSRDRARLWLKRVRRLKTWQLVVLLLIGVIVSATFLRLNNQHMSQLRTAVINADDAGDATKLQNSIVSLQGYVSHHMNTSLDNGFFLTKTYQRDQDKAITSASSQTNPNSAVYEQASVDCRAQFKGGSESFRDDYVACVVAKVSALDNTDNSVQSAYLVNPDAYRVAFASPLWTPDLAGYAVLYCVVIIAVIISRIVFVIILRLILRRHYNAY